MIVENTAKFDQLEEKLNLLHFSGKTSHTVSKCTQDYEDDLKKLQKPLVCSGLSVFKDKYTFDLSPLDQNGVKTDQTEMKHPSSYHDIKTQASQWLTAQSKQNYNQQGIVTNFYELKHVMHVETGERRVAKIYRKSELSEDLVLLVKKEISYFQLLDHPNIARCFDVLEDRTKIYMLLENFQGKSLFEHVMHNGELTESQTVQIVAQIVSVLRYLHKKNIVLRNMNMNSFRLYDHGLLSDIRLVDMLLAIKANKIKAEAGNFLEKQIFMATNKIFQGKQKYHHAFDHSMSAPELIPDESEFQQEITDDKAIRGELVQNAMAVRKYDFQVDVWSLGCISFNLFTGVPPFFENSDNIMFKRIKGGDWKNNQPEETYFQPDDGTDINESKIKQATFSMIQYFEQSFQLDPKKRITSQRLVTDKFVKAHQDRFAKLSKQKVNEMFTNIKNFKTLPGFQSEVFRYIVQRFLQQKERDFIRQLFNTLDEEKDGELEPQEMIDSFKKNFQLELADQRWTTIIKNVDFQEDGNIQFTEFLVAASRKQHLFSPENLLAAFQYFDRDKDGKITARDLSALLDIDLAAVSTSKIGISYAEIIHKEAEAEHQQFLLLQQKQESAKLKALKQKMRDMQAVNADANGSENWLMDQDGGGEIKSPEKEKKDEEQKKKEKSINGLDYKLFQKVMIGLVSQKEDDGPEK